MVAHLYADLGVTQRNRTRDRVYSNDNPFSEAHFKTLKYRPDFPERFGSAQHSRAHLHGPILPTGNFTTASNDTAASASSRRTTYTTASPMSAAPRELASSPPRTPPILSASPPAYPRRPHRPLPFGSTHQR